MEFKISKELADAIINYLAQKPFAEVYQLVAGLQQIKPVEAPVYENKAE